MTEKSKQSSLILPMTLLAVFVLHLLITMFLLPDKLPFLVIAVHGYLTGLLFVGLFLVKKVKSIDHTKVGMTFLAITMFKMMFAIGFLLVMYNYFPVDRMIITIHFFIPFFIYLTIEVMLTLKEIR